MIGSLFSHALLFQLPQNRFPKPYVGEIRKPVEARCLSSNLVAEVIACQVRMGGLDQFRVPRRFLEGNRRSVDGEGWVEDGSTAIGSNQT